MQNNQCGVHQLENNKLYQTLSQLGAYNPTINAAQREGSGHARLEPDVLEFTHRGGWGY